MTDRQINVLVYTGTGASLSAVQHALYSLRQHLSPNYAVLPLTTEILLHEPWTATCALLVFPGGADLGYCRALNGAGNRLIRQYVEGGGRYLGLCAGGYYGSGKCEFEKGSPAMEVIGERELGFFKGTCQGSVFKGFEYGSDKGTRAAMLRVNNGALGVSAQEAGNVRIYANGGGCFVGARNMEDVEVLARYDEDVDVGTDYEKSAAVVYCKVGEGAATLTGPHPEFAISNISPDAKGLSASVYAALKESDTSRDTFFRSLLSKLGLEVTQQSQQPPSLAPLHITSPTPSVIDSILKDLEEVTTTIDGSDYIKGEADTFLLQQPESPWSMTSLTRAALDILSSTAQSLTDTPNSNTYLVTPPTSGKDERGHAAPVDHTQIIKSLVFHASIPTLSTLSHFDHTLYFSYLTQNPTPNNTNTPTFGNPLITTTCTTSTSTLLSSNPRLTSRLPNGTTFTASTQLSGRGRGSNVWVSPPGALMFTTVFKHGLELNAKAPVVFVQYLAAIAVVAAVKSYNPSSTDSSSETGYQDIPIRLKWPNDIYALGAKSVGRELAEGDEGWREQYTKIGGILVNTSYSGGDFSVILGIGLNLSNAVPTTSLNTLIHALNAQRSEKDKLELMKPEILLAGIMARFGELYEMFRDRGFAGELERRYTGMWLHSEQTVTLETEGGAKARVKGVSSDWGLLVAEEVGGERELDGEGGGEDRRFALQSDSNSFDFFKGLLKRKL